MSEVLGANSYICRSYRGKTGRGPFWSPTSWIGLKQVHGILFFKIFFEIFRWTSNLGIEEYTQNIDIFFLSFLNYFPWCYWAKKAVNPFLWWTKCISEKKLHWMCLLKTVYLISLFFKWCKKAVQLFNFSLQLFSIVGCQ